MTAQPVPNLTTFTYSSSVELRTATDEQGETIVCLADLAHGLGIKNPSDLHKRIPDEVVRIYPIVDRLGRTQRAKFVTEAGMNMVIWRSDKPEAIAYAQWCAERIAELRRTGTYAATPSVPQPDLSELSPRNLAYLSELAKGLEAAVKHAEKNQRKADGYDQFLNGSGCYLVDTAANLLGVKHRRLWEWLYTSKLLIPHGPRKRQPYANPKTASWFAVKTYNTDRTNGKARATTYITPVGLEAIRLRLIREGVIQSTLFALPAPVREVLA